MSSIALFFLSPLLKWLTLSTGIAAAGIAIFVFTPAWFPMRFRRVALEIGVGALIVGGFFLYAFEAGERHATQKIAAKDAGAIERKDRAFGRIQSCIDLGGVWNVTIGDCDH